jgi:hypothetical protein
MFPDAGFSIATSVAGCVASIYNVSASSVAFTPPSDSCIDLQTKHTKDDYGNRLNAQVFCDRRVGRGRLYSSGSK